VRKSGGGWRTFWFMLAGLLIGSMVGDILGSNFHTPYVDASTLIHWHPAGNFSVFKYDLNLQVRLNLLGLLGVGVGYWLSRKL